jgi:hypothetical protein
LIPAGTARSKTAVREAIVDASSIDRWTVLQSHVYGARMHAAHPFTGALEFFRECRLRGVPAYIVSHKTRFAAMGEPHDLHASARGWLEAHGFVSAGGADAPLESAQVYFAPTREEKIDQIVRLGCTHFVDDLPEVFAEPAFPADVVKILFDPSGIHASWRGGVRASSWLQLAPLLRSTGAAR